MGRVHLGEPNKGGQPGTKAETSGKGRTNPEILNEPGYLSTKINVFPNNDLFSEQQPKFGAFCSKALFSHTWASQAWVIAPVRWLGASRLPFACTEQDGLSQLSPSSTQAWRDSAPSD